MPLPERVKVEIIYTILTKKLHIFKIFPALPIPGFVTVREIHNDSIEDFVYYLSGPSIEQDHEICKNIECKGFTEDVRVVCEEKGDEFEDLMKDHDWRSNFYFEPPPESGWYS